MKAVQQYVKYHILQPPSSAHAPVRWHKLLTMSNVKSSWKRSTQKEKEARQVIKCLRRRLAWCNHTKSTYDSSEEQYSVLPRALADENGNWKLRLSSLKNMAPLFAAFDRDTYERIAPNHLADLQQYPQQILSAFESGGFTVSLGGEVIKCLRRRLAWCNHTKLTYDSSEEQYSVLSRALADENGNPHKASKSNWSDKLERAAINLVSSWNFHHGFHRWPLWMPCLWSILGH